MRLVVRWIITAVALGIAAFIVPGISVTDQNGLFTVLVTAAILGLANAFIRPILSFLSCGFIILTLGLFTLVINAAMLGLASYVATALGFGFFVDGFWPALFGSIVVSIVSALLSIFLPDRSE